MGKKPRKGMDDYRVVEAQHLKVGDKLRVYDARFKVSHLIVKGITVDETVSLEVQDVDTNTLEVQHPRHTDNFEVTN